MKLTKVRITGAAVGLLIILIAFVWLFVSNKDLSIHMVYVTKGDSFDTAAFGQLNQSLVANLQLERQPLEKLSLRQLKAFHTVYVDPSLHGALSVQQVDMLQSYVSQGGHLFLENGLASDFPLDFIGAKQLVGLAPPDKMKASTQPQEAGWSSFQYPEVELNLQAIQQLFRQFTDNYLQHDGLADLGRFSWGQGLLVSTAEPIVTLNDTTLFALNRYGHGTVFVSSALLPNRYYITGYDLAGGMDAALGFTKLAETRNNNSKPALGALYFDRSQLPLAPYFHFTFSTGSALLRSEYAAFVSKETFGYSVKKVLGPYGRPAMAHQNHFEAIEAIRDGEGIQWAELLKKYKQLPSFSLVRSSFHWGLWQESVAVHLNTGTNEKPVFVGETVNSFYSSGTRLISDGRPIQLARDPNYHSLGDAFQEPYRAYPALADLNGNGLPELIVGSSDGSVYVYPNLGSQPEAYAGQVLPESTGAGEVRKGTSIAAPDAFGKREPLRLLNGQPLQTGSNASVTAYDLNADGRPDLILGLSDGTLAVAYGAAGGAFTPPAPLLAGGQVIRAAAPVAAAIGDTTGDGVPDLIVGDAAGGVMLYRGHREAGREGAAGAGGVNSGAARQPLAFEPGSLLFRLPAAYAAPSLRDVNGDGRLELVVGSSEGDLRVYTQQANGQWQADGVLEGSTLNQLGNHALVGGHNSVPLWYDLNHDGKDDLIVGQLEFGMPTTVDDPKFPYAEQLQAFIQYSKDHYLELYPHLFVHNFTSDAQEKEELALHRQAFDRLGIPWKMPGTNQHTWRINNPDPTQTLRNERDAGIWFNFGFRPANIPNEPRLGVQYNWGMPFLMTDSTSGLPSQPPMLLSTPAPVLRLDPQYTTEDLFDSYIAQDMPIDYFEHIEYHFPSRVGELLEFVKFLDQIRNQHSYNFMSETQMARSVLNTLTTQVTVYRPWSEVVFDRIKHMFGMRTEPMIRIKPLTQGVPEQAAEYKGTLGVSIERGQAYADRPLSTESDIFDWRNDKLYVGVPLTTLVRFENSKPSSDNTVPIADFSLSTSSPHLLRSNVPYTLHKAPNEWKLELQSDGMQQIQLRSAVPLNIVGDQLQVVQQDGSDLYTVTHFGAATTILIHY
ncbi:VCBS repeat-containing protein [Paenibacillus sp. WQ 127069]|uniref:VCBS repeat-containing protein n=1 Tax=Paenibacillus baimaensis TaxID=2982185 RepID=A0ABT2UE43_9BACL|nr:VCBS repeat-containing protein [Paenibacillus sp. WQ 127069]MCU6792904.1 VCBS repeat-containing protein [Paenibacillus sp. WQ 127069]